MPEDSSFYTCVPKTMMTDGQTDEEMDGKTDGRTEKVTYRGGCPT